MKKIEDQYTDMDLTSQRRHQLRYPDRHYEQNKRYLDSPVGKAMQREADKRYRAKKKLSTPTNVDIVKH